MLFIILIACLVLSTRCVVSEDMIVIFTLCALIELVLEVLVLATYLTH